MRARFTFVALIALLVAGVIAPATPGPALAQGDEQPASEDEGPQLEEQDVSGEEGRAGEGAEAETGAGGESGDAATETGPLWTYQMSRMALLGLFPLILVMGLLYYRLVVRRARGQA